MPEIQAAASLPWRDGADVQAAASLPWRDGGNVQSIGSAYTRPAVGGGVVTTPGSLAARRDILAAGSYQQNVVLAVIDLRTNTALPVESVTLDLPDGSDLWSLQAQGSAALADAIRAGDQPATLEVAIGPDRWRFVIEAVDQPLTFGNSGVTLRGRSLAAAAGAPYAVQQTWITDAPTSAAQVSALANTFTGVSIDWRAPDWLIQAGAWSATADPLGVVRQMAAAVRADVECHPTDLAITVRSRYATAPNTWASQAPDVQIAWAAFEAVSQERADQPEYEAVLVSGQQAGGVLQARLAGTSGSKQAPMVTDPLLTDLPAQLELATTMLYGYGGRSRESRTLQMHGGVIKRGLLARCVEPAGTWTGCVRAVSVRAQLESARQTLVIERPTSFVVGTAEPEFIPPGDPSFNNVVLLLHGEGVNGGNAFIDSSSFARTPSSAAGCVTTTTNPRFGGACIESTTISGNLTWASSADFALPLVYTLEFWMFLASLPAATTFLLGHTNARHFTLSTSGALAPTGWNTSTLGTCTLATGVWQHYALTRDETGYNRNFKNGVLLGGGSNGTTDSTPRAFNLLGIPGRPDLRSFLGKIDAFRYTQNVCRYSDSFTPPVVPFPNYL